MAWWVYKCSTQNRAGIYNGDWQEFFDDPTQEWGDVAGLQALSKLQEGDFVIAYQSNLNEIVGLTRVKQATEVDGYLYLQSKGEIHARVLPLKSDPKIAAIRAFQPGNQRAICTITAEEAKYLLDAARKRETGIWFCNQSRSWTFERKHSVVCASDRSHSLKYRRLVGMVKKGDVIVHYEKSKIVAISLAQRNANRNSRPLPAPFKENYETGWLLRTCYFELNPPVPLGNVTDALRDHVIEDGPFDLNGHVKQGGYFFRFDTEGLMAVREACRGKWPLPETDGGNALEGFSEGGTHTVVQTVRNSGLREEAKRIHGLKCYCCGFDFERFYGPKARDRAIVHHLDLFSRDGSMRQSTVDRVRVVCANCHYVIHLSKKPRDVEELKREIEGRWTRWSEEGVTRSSSSRNSTQGQ